MAEIGRARAFPVGGDAVVALHAVADRHAGEIAFALIHCTGGDVLITTVTLAAAVALAHHLRWPACGWRMVFTAIVLGTGSTIFSEWLNVAIRGTWSYTAAMPVVPFLGTGITPLLQWLIVPGLALAVTGYRYRRAGRLARCRRPTSL